MGKYLLVYGGACLLGLASQSFVGFAICVGTVAVCHGALIAIWES